jgi:hypothetical protein
MAKSVPKYSTHAGGDTGFADQYFSSLLGVWAAEGKPLMLNY